MSHGPRRRDGRLAHAPRAPRRRAARPRARSRRQPRDAARRRRSLPLSTEVQTELAVIGRALDRTAATLLEDAESLRHASSALQAASSACACCRCACSSAASRGRSARSRAKPAGRRDRRARGDAGSTARWSAPVGEVLVHLVRNAIAHGIEPVAEGSRGKPARGLLRLDARQGGDFVYIEVCDDGAGIDPDRIRASLVAAGTLDEADARARPTRRFWRTSSTPVSRPASRPTRSPAAAWASTPCASL